MSAHRTAPRHASLLLPVALVVLAAGCATPAGPSVSIPFSTWNDSGVTGTVTLVELGPRLTRVEIRVQAAGHPDMPAHIHPGSCADAISQPKYPIENVRDGASNTEVPASLDELRTEAQSLNLHSSNENMRLVTACVDLAEGAPPAVQPTPIPFPTG